MLQLKVGQTTYKRISLHLYGSQEDWDKDFSLFRDQNKYLEENKKILECIEKAERLLQEMQKYYEVTKTPFS